MHLNGQDGFSELMSLEGWGFFGVLELDNWRGKRLGTGKPVRKVQCGKRSVSESLFCCLLAMWP